jgi:hypothetical protein
MKIKIMFTLQRESLVLLAEACVSSQYYMRVLICSVSSYTQTHTHTHTHTDALAGSQIFDYLVFLA